MGGSTKMGEGRGQEGTAPLRGKAPAQARLGAQMYTPQESPHPPLAVPWEEAAGLRLAAAHLCRGRGGGAPVSPCLGGAPSILLALP